MRWQVFITTALVVALADTATANTKFFYDLASGSCLKKILCETTQPIGSVHKIPRYVLAAARRITQDDFKLANPNERYISGCGVILPDDAGLPYRQLVFATQSSSHILIFYRHGGYAQGECVLAFRIDPARREAEPVWVGRYVGSRPVESLDDLRRAFARNDVQQYRPTYIDF
jgi:hypothetical protein